MVEYKIINANIVDGTGRPPFFGDVAIQGEKVVAVGNLKDVDSYNVIDADGRNLTPGFIDFHTHSDLSVMYDSRSANRIYNGVTADVIGNCGIGVAPVNEKYKSELTEYLKTRLVGNIPGGFSLEWNTYGEYIDAINASHPAINIIPILAHGAIHIHEKGLLQEKADETDMVNMRNELRKAMECGAVGLSSGLIYLPGSYTEKKEFLSLCKEMKPFAGVYFTHIRDEGDRQFEAIEEAADVAGQSGIPLHISHLKITGTKNRGRAKELFMHIADLKKRGITVTYDAYPYSCGMTSLLALLPPWVAEGGVNELIKRVQSMILRTVMIHDMRNGLPGWRASLSEQKKENDIIICQTRLEKNAWMEGKNLGEIANIVKCDVFTLIFDLIVEEHARTLIIVPGMDDNDVTEIISNPDTMIGSDSITYGEDGLLSHGCPHPRTFGTQARFLSEYCRNRGLFPIEQAIKRLTSMPAAVLGLRNRGTIAVGNYADLTIFDLSNIRDNATYQVPKHYSQGMDYVFVNGRPALYKGVQTNERSGRVVTRNG